ncbi:MAG: DUF2769 domain-containing protein [Nitrospirae bacterium]|nr:DUF2769 domain-containing protein [Nitrospirota bacterium]
MPKVEDNQENADICMKYCGPCLTYPGGGEALFCARGKSVAKPEKQGCNCGVCDVQKKYFNRNTYYCINGAASE